ncbi:MAG TPA: glycosyltransferase family 2 protein [Bacteroidales bacterium]|nr:glycosyltransferase [Bacteroidales bacterium]HCI56301.1 glycosyl transferase [Bacteroidales bacterium]HOU95076.1 glycosyltransferase family 2 protein [Bacteroidales bacterium]HQG36434.1 glycosyltransferase family 2 protein [Bacteroidales bacterium]HQG53660.1 glycosyltransferase family 2 protein [Bacteroidales bacterium]
MKISIITVCHNSVKTIRDTIESVLKQTYRDIEYIIIDGNSCDGTVELVNSYSDRIDKFISEPDSGMYNALNKGIKLASGDVIGILNSDDFLYNEHVIRRIADEFDRYGTDSVIGDVIFVRPDNFDKIVRYYSSAGFTPEKFKYGIMPAHPAFYVKRKCYEKYGLYKEDYRIGSDFDLLLRFLLIHKITYRYLELPFVTMRTGGKSNKSFFSNIIINKEIARACRENGVKTNYFKIYSKYFYKVFEFFGNK